MRKTLVAMTAAIFMLTAGIASADDTKVTLGVKMWSNKWEEKSEILGGGSSTTDMGSSLMVGPALNIRFPSNWFIGATYLKSTKDYEQKDAATGDTFAFERKDLDLTLGYMFSPQFGLFFGYKTIDAPATFKMAGISDFSVGTWKLKGPGIGILGNIPLGESAALYGNLALLKMKQEFVFSDQMAAFAGSSGIPSYDTVGASLEIGLAMAFTQNLSANIGIKSQSFSGTDEFDTTYTDTFAGLTGGLNFTF